MIVNYFNRKEYEKKIEEHKTFPEVYFSNGKIFKSLFYYSDEAMLWSANHLAYCQELNIN